MAEGAITRAQRGCRQSISARSAMPNAESGKIVVVTFVHAGIYGSFTTPTSAHPAITAFAYAINHGLAATSTIQFCRVA